MKIFKLAFVAGLWWHAHAIWHQQLFGDEVHSLFFMQNTSWLSLWLKAVEPIHPNGLYLLLKALYALMPSVTLLRIWIFIFFIASCVVLRLILKKLNFSPTIIWITLALWSSSAYFWHFSFQLRMYGPAILLLLLSLWMVLDRRPWLSVLFDWLSLFFAYGSIIFVIAKWLAWIVVKKPTPTQLLPPLIGLIPTFFVMGIFLSQRTLVDASFLYWVRPPAISDWSLAFITFMSGLFLPYFEGYSLLGKSWIVLGWLMNILGIAGIILSLVIGWHRRRVVKKWWRHLATDHRSILIMGLLTFGMYTALFAWSLLVGGHLFHIRQMFPIAMIHWLLLSWVFAQLRKKTVLLTVVVLIIIGFNQLSIARDSLGSGQTYVHHFQTLPGTPLLVSSADVELLYKQCHTFDRTQVDHACAQRQIFLRISTTPSLLQTDRWWMTTRAYSEQPSTNCQPVSIDYVVCELVDQDLKTE